MSAPAQSRRGISVRRKAAPRGVLTVRVRQDVLDSLRYVRSWARERGYALDVAGAVDRALVRLLAEAERKMGKGEGEV